MSILQDLLSAQPTKPVVKPAQAPVAEAKKQPVEPIVERKAAPVEANDDVIPGHDPAHPNYKHHKAHADVLKKNNPRVYAKMLNWD